MKSIKFKTAIIICGFIFYANLAFSQMGEVQASVHFSVPEVALVDIEPSLNNSIHFTVNPASESGNSAVIQETESETLWINYSSALTNSQNTRSIVAQISQGVLPDGISLYLEASQYYGSGDGQLGHPAGRINLTSQPQPIITGLGSCYTGDGINNGHSLSFTMEISDYSKIHAVDETDFTIMYTITDN